MYIFSEMFRSGDTFTPKYFKFEGLKVVEITEEEYKIIQTANRKPFLDYIASKKARA